MAPLSHDLAGIILPHDTFGNHLDASGNTIDPKLEETNFYAASDVLSEIWSKTVIDNGYDVPELSVSLDAIHLMSYDMHGSWENFVDHHGKLYGDAGDDFTVDQG